MLFGKFLNLISLHDDVERFSASIGFIAVVSAEFNKVGAEVVGVGILDEAD